MRAREKNSINKMSLLIWNARGLNKIERRKDVLEHIQKYKPSMVALVETKIKMSKFDRIKSCTRKQWQSCHNFHLSARGRIWISWDPTVWVCTVHSVSL